MSNYNTEYLNDCIRKANEANSFGNYQIAMLHTLTSIAKSLSAIADIMETEAKIEYEDDDEDDDDEDSDD